ncbi:MAG: hypothetical protein ACXAEE_04525 [Candidatus Thorarchaeota archaeon]|jgi:hypothetical protein
MTWLDRHPIRTDSKSIALLAIFTAMVVSLEVFPIVGVTDIGAPGGFTIDWTGIPIVIVFIGLGFVYSLVAIAAMWMAIAYRNFNGAAFKGFAELYTILGLLIAKILIGRFNLDRRVRILSYLVFGSLFRVVGMFITNIYLLQVFYGLTPEASVIGSAAYAFPNIIQAVINILGGVVLYHLIPENLALQAGLGDDAVSASSRVEELPLEEIESSQPDDPVDGGQG